MEPERRVEELRGRMAANGWMTIMLGLVMIGLTSFILALFEVPAVIIAGVIIVMVIVSWGIAAHFYHPGDYRVVETPAPPRDDRGWAARMHSKMQSEGTFEQAAGACVCGFDPLGELIGQRTLTEETGRIVRARVVNPRWIDAMRRHGYKGAFEMAATVDFLFGWDATTGVVDDWMYEQVSQSYVLDPDNRAFLDESNPWALHGMSERLLEAADRGLWESPDPATLDGLRAAFLEAEGELEDR